MKVKGSHVLITGGCGDIGLGIARAFIDQEKRVTPVDIDAQPGSELASAHDQVQIVELDLADAESTAETLGALAKSDDAPDILVNGVG